MVNMIQVIKDTDQEIYEKFKIKAKTITDNREILKSFKEYKSKIYEAFKELIIAFNNSQKHNNRLSEYIYIKADYHLPELSKLTELSTNTKMLKSLLNTIILINKLNDEKIKNKYDNNLQELDYKSFKTSEINRIFQKIKDFEEDDYVEHDYQEVEVGDEPFISDDEKNYDNIFTVFKLLTNLVQLQEHLKN
jgi:hypothetical protein